MYHLFRLAAARLSTRPTGRRLVEHLARHALFYETFYWSGVVLVLLIALNSLVVESCTVHQASMAHTLQEGDRILINRFVYPLGLYQRGDIVVFTAPNNQRIRHPGLLYVKRLAGLPGERMALQRGQLLINGQAVTTPSVFARTFYHPKTLFSGSQIQPVRPGEVYVLGDNSLVSSDSREWGGVPLANLRGRAFFRFWPPSRFGFINATPRSRQAPAP